MLRPKRWIGLSLIATALTSCSFIQDLGQRDAGLPESKPPVVNDQPRLAPLQPGENVIVRAVERVGPAVVRIDTVKEISNPLSLSHRGCGVTPLRGRPNFKLTSSDL